MQKSPKPRKKSLTGSSVDSAEVGQFESLASRWWDESGPFRPLHRLNPARLEYLKQRICAHFGRQPEGFTPLTGLSIADIGCGGGLVTEPLCRLGARVTGIDAGTENIAAARRHAREQGLDIAYQATTAELLADSGKKFDVVTALEIVEHVADLPLFVAACCKLVKKDGLIIFSTLNRTPKAFLLGIVAAEHVLRWLPAGTHDWKKFVRPSELARLLAAQGFESCDISGLVYRPLSRRFDISRTDIDVNYFLTAASSRSRK